MIRVVLDTNILISASFWKGNPHQIMQLAIEGKIEAFTTTEILEEYAKVLARDFKLTEENIQKRIKLFLKIMTVVRPTVRVRIVMDDPDDDKIIEAAIAANTNYIISGDPDLYKLIEIQGIKIVTPNEFIKNRV